MLPEDKADALAVLAELDPYTQLKKLERLLEFLELQEDYIKDELKNLKRELIRAQVGTGSGDVEGNRATDRKGFEYFGINPGRRLWTGHEYRVPIRVWDA